MEKRTTAGSAHFQAQCGQDGSQISTTTIYTSPSRGSLSKFMKNKRKRLENGVERGSSVANDELAEDAVQTTASLTEMEKQVVALQGQHPDMLLLFECGYRMRIFGRDAELAARVLGIRAQRHRAFVEASVPVHRTLFHSRRLVNAGLKVGIVKQLSTVVRANGQPLERGVVQVFTRATIPLEEESDSDLDKGNGDIRTSVEDVDGGGSGRFIVSIVEETIHATRLFAKLVHEIDASDRHATQLETVRIGVFGHDVHAGESVFDEFEDDSKRGRLRECLDQLSPIEFVLPVGGVSPTSEQVILAYAQQPADFHNHQAAPRKICRIERVPFTDEDTASQSLTSNSPVMLPALVQICAVGMKSYLKSLKLPSALSLQGLHISNTGCLLSHTAATRMRLSQAALRDLGIFSDKASGFASLFSILNHTYTTFGARRLRDWIRYPLLEVDEIQERLDCVQYLSTVGGEGSVVLESLRSDVLPTAAPIERLLQQLHLRRASPRSVVKLIRSLDEVEMLFVEIVGEEGDDVPSNDVLKLRSRSLLAEYPRSKGAFTTISDELDIDAAAANDIEGTISKHWTQFPREKADYDAICTALGALEVQFAETLSQCRRALNSPTLEYCSHRAGGNGKIYDHLVAIDRTDVASVPDDWIVVSSTKAIVRYYPRQVRVLQMEQDLLLERKSQLINAVWLEVVASIDATVYAVGMRAVDILADLDALCSLATAVRLYPGYTRPTIFTGKPIDKQLAIVRGRHPVLELEAAQGCSYIAGDVSLSGRGAALIVSGPNMGGKSTLLRMTALLVILAQIGMFVPAESMELRCFDAIQTRMHRISSTGAGAEELQELAVIAKTATPSTLVLLDEVGYGLTSRQAKTLAFNTVKYLLQSVQCCVLMATHMTDIALRLRDECDDADGSRVQIQELAHEVAVSLKDSHAMGDAAVVYHYTTRDGVANRSFALEAAAMAGIPASILEAAAARKEDR